VIFNIQRFSVHDGTGIRTIIFFKGCSLHCPWCDNPESQSFHSELGWDVKKCICCLECARVARDGEMEVIEGRPVFHLEKIDNPQKFADVCPSDALVALGKEKNVTEIVREAARDIPFYKNSGGGVTISGGEPFEQPLFLLELLKALKDIDVTITIETNLNVLWSAIESCIPFIETYLVDFKHANSAILKEITGGNFKRITDNLENLERANRTVIARVPVIPNFNDSLSNIADIIELVASYSNIHVVHFLPFHTLAMGKYHLLGRNYHFLTQADSARDMSEYLDFARNKGLNASVGG
jgi:pyruvate formate lyase activating enzyme